MLAGRNILLAVILAVAVSSSALSQELKFRGNPQGIQPSNYPTYAIVTVSSSTQTTLSWFTTLAKAYTVSTTPLYLTQLIISSSSAQPTSVDFYNLSTPTTGLTNANKVFGLDVAGNTTPLNINFASPIYFSNGLTLLPSSASLTILPTFYK